MTIREGASLKSLDFVPTSTEQVIDLPETPPPGEDTFGEPIAIPEGNVPSSQQLSGTLIVRRFQAAQVNGEKPRLSGTLLEKLRNTRIIPEVIPEPTREELNSAARMVLDANFIRTIWPIAQSLRGGPLGPDVEAAIFGGPVDGQDRPTRYGVSEQILERQRPLASWEREQIGTMEQMSSVNSYLVAALRNPEITSVCLDAHFDRVTTETRERFPDGSFAPMAIIGAGVHGTAAAGHVLRMRPDIAAKSIVIERGKPGGPFGYVNGEAWDLNSASPAGAEPFALPYDDNRGTIRSLGGGVLPWYPGERRTFEGSARQGSINYIAEPFPAPDFDSDKRYIDNWRFATAVRAQAALVAPNLSCDTNVVSVEPNTTSQKGALRLQLEDIYPDGSKATRFLYTDEVVLTAGKQEPGRALRDVAIADLEIFENDLAEVSKGPRLPVYLRGLEIYKTMADRASEKLEHGTKFVLIGDGNSAETQLEMLAGIYEGARRGNMDITKIEKITVVGPRATEKIACRRRYKLLLDLLARNGRENVLQLVDGRVNDIMFRSDPDSPLGESISLVRNSGGLLQNDKGEVVQADHILDSTGYKSDLEATLGKLVEADGYNSVEDALEPVYLDGTQLVVGQRLRSRPNVTLLGTVATPVFDEAKLRQLPDTSRDVIEKVSENVVAIGFRVPETRAAIDQLLRTSPLLPKPDVSDITPKVVGRTLPMGNPQFRGSSYASPTKELPPIDNRVEPNADLLTPLLLSPMAQDRLADRGRYQYSFVITIGSDLQSLSTEALNGAPAAVIQALASAAASNPHFIGQACRAIEQRRGGKAIEVSLAYENGMLRLKNSYVQAI